MSVRRPAEVAASLAFASAAVTLFWTLGGTLLLDTVGGAMEDLARDRSLGSLVVGATVVVLKLAAGLLALALVRSSRNPVRRRKVLVANGLVSAVLILWGAVNVAAGAFVLSGVIDGSAEADRHALRWHVFVWDLWFLLWGLALAMAVAAAWRRSAPDGRDDVGGLRAPA